MMENPIKMDDLGVPLFSETPIWWIGELWNIFVNSFQGKLYGTMDDLRLEHHRVQAKYIATWRRDHFPLQRA